MQHLGTRVGMLSKRRAELLFVSAGKELQATFCMEIKSQPFPEMPRVHVLRASCPKACGDAAPVLQGREAGQPWWSPAATSLTGNADRGGRVAWCSAEKSPAGFAIAQATSSGDGTKMDHSVLQDGGSRSAEHRASRAEPGKAVSQLG